MKIKTAAIIINLVGLAIWQVGLIFNQRLFMTWVTTGWLWPVVLVMLITLTMFDRTIDHQDQR